ncbi:hypothetical protein BDY21DRAFT_348531 [Lineolata rhizophorae]|uniref:Uncharacterized protein n=1 Tax=Lineolata rhizophorae TaxID=578093 RepID=A0A6A6NVD4_9PEZI|nr:hypothetical protein BDY21DRAFT_348531 [Lineolata rhizophorae]
MTLFVHSSIISSRSQIIDYVGDFPFLHRGPHVWQNLQFSNAGPHSQEGTQPPSFLGPLSGQTRRARLLAKYPAPRGRSWVLSWVLSASPAKWADRRRGGLCRATLTRSPYANLRLRPSPVR